MHRRHILPKNDERKWQQHRDPFPRSYMQKPVMIMPPFHSSRGVPSSQVYPIWGHPSYYPSGHPMWGPSGFSAWYPPQGSLPWKTNPGVMCCKHEFNFLLPLMQFSILEYICHLSLAELRKK